METINAKYYSLPIQTVAQNCTELKEYLNDYKMNLGDSSSLQIYNKCLFRILENIELVIPEEKNLIPTCGLRRAIVETIQRKINPASVIEVGTGAYAIIALLLARRGVRNVIATDINEQSIHSAQFNIKLNGCDDFISLYRSSGGILTWIKDIIPKDLPFIDVLVSLPPYYDVSQKNNAEKGFLGVDSELYDSGSGTNFTLKLIQEWIQFPSSIYFLVILIKNKIHLETAENFIKTLENKNKKKIHLEKIRLLAGTRTRYLLILNTRVN